MRFGNFAAKPSNRVAYSMHFPQGKGKAARTGAQAFRVARFHAARLLFQSSGLPFNNLIDLV